MSSDKEEPRLPPELEKPIFEYAFLYDRGHPLNILLVSKRVHNWIIPFVYEILVIGSIPLQSIVRHGHHVRHLLLIHDTTPIIQILRHCKNIVNLAMWTVPYVPEWILEAQALTNLTHVAGYMILPIPYTRIENRSPLQLCTLQSPPGSQMCNWTSTITHLELTIGSNHWPDYEPLPQFISLSHLSISDDVRISIILDLLFACPALKVVVVEYLVGLDIVEPRGQSVQLRNGDGIVEGVDDVRVVAVDRNATQDWVVGARGGMNAWRLAEEEVIRRMRIPSSG